MKVLAVGDIHCKADTVFTVCFAEENYDAIVFVGDYADDWNATPQDTIDTWKALKKFQDEFPEKIKVLMGNHDYIYVNYTKTISSGYNKFTQTLIDMPENRELREWLRNLPVNIEIDGVVYSHAGMSEEWMASFTFNNHDHYTPKNLWRDDSPIWARPDSVNYRDDFPQVFGHTPSETCWEVKPNVWCIDTLSTYPNGEPVGDLTVLEITDGKKFNVKSVGDLGE